MWTHALVGFVVALAISIFAPEESRAQSPYPARTVRIVVPSAAGSTTDTVARIVADRLARVWANSVIVENVAGGAMNTGAAMVARAAPDGATLLVAPPAPLTFNDLLYRDLAYRPSEFVPITLLAKIPNILVVRKAFPASSLGELIAYAKANPGRLSYASQGVGSTAHLSASQLEVLAGIKMVHVPYRGAQPALADVMAGNVDLFFDTPTTSVPLYRAGMIKILAVADAVRTPALPEVPTFGEAGLPGFRSITWFALVAPPATPAALAERINHDTVEVLDDPDVAKRLRQLSLEPGATTRADTAKFFAEETALWSKVIREAKIEPQ
ncbi:MAG TPA: tripartite tricarboxylate transporter substrate-binding protein [Xanthobacteraceae bacterium]|jgi:tripartite-type tricarboxylate transporter receptor subunit TctC|nr:tripartite tricarboxylate transporter substrate-binding protein [Xanthobacteraceae bacterium]